MLNAIRLRFAIYILYIKNILGRSILGKQRIYNESNHNFTFHTNRNNKVHRTYLCRCKNAQLPSSP